MIQLWDFRILTYCDSTDEGLKIEQDQAQQFDADSTAEHLQTLQHDMQMLSSSAVALTSDAESHSADQTPVDCLQVLLNHVRCVSANASESGLNVSESGMNSLLYADAWVQTDLAHALFEPLNDEVRDIMGDFAPLLIHAPRTLAAVRAQRAWTLERTLQEIEQAWTDIALRSAARTAGRSLGAAKAYYLSLLQREPTRLECDARVLIMIRSLHQHGEDVVVRMFGRMCGLAQPVLPVQCGEWYLSARSCIRARQRAPRHDGTDVLDGLMSGACLLLEGWTEAERMLKDIEGRARTAIAQQAAASGRQTGHLSELFALRCNIEQFLYILVDIFAEEVQRHSVLFVAMMQTAQRGESMLSFAKFAHAVACFDPLVPERKMFRMYCELEQCVADAERSAAVLKRIAIQCGGQRLLRFHMSLAPARHNARATV
eukprot:TRINITY_DN9065_c0_g1_i3.p1 TRINITY_DN9065_c0_g1~~TRINITY_DN9065_c0_g1_i3.p1  ORF type:complete len:430 (-),score=97.62 TRINITY_DN9065_c0_g1_i3:270-1559(-)